MEQGRVFGIVSSGGCATGTLSALLSSPTNDMVCFHHGVRTGYEEYFARQGSVREALLQISIDQGVIVGDIMREINPFIMDDYGGGKSNIIYLIRNPIRRALSILRIYAHKFSEDSLYFSPTSSPDVRNNLWHMMKLIYMRQGKIINPQLFGKHRIWAERHTQRVVWLQYQFLYRLMVFVLPHDRRNFHFLGKEKGFRYEDYISNAECMECLLSGVLSKFHVEKIMAIYNQGLPRIHHRSAEISDEFLVKTLDNDMGFIRLCIDSISDLLKEKVDFNMQKFYMEFNYDLNNE